MIPAHRKKLEAVNMLFYPSINKYVVLLHIGPVEAILGHFIDWLVKRQHTWLGLHGYSGMHKFFQLEQCPYFR
jgi:hypothetical protein